MISEKRTVRKNMSKAKSNGVNFYSNTDLDQLSLRDDSFIDDTYQI
jgi:hypothetical protein